MDRLARSRGTYVCLEGLDGSGKTTLLEGLARKLRSKGADFETVRPTKPLESRSLLERAVGSGGPLEGSRLLRAFLYARRSNGAFRKADWGRPLILGDRGVVTSYAVRWRHFGGGDRASVLLVDALEPLLPAPDHVLFLDAPPEVLRSRLLKRGKPLDIDETRERSEEMRAAYREIMRSSRIPRLRKTVWHVLDARKPPRELCRDALEIVEGVTPLKRFEALEAFWTPSLAEGFSGAHC